MELINEQASGNWALKASNVKTLLRAIELFYHDELGQLCDANELIDAHLIAKESDAQEVARLVELVLGCAVQCPSRSEYIHPILQMGASEQASLMHLIENIMHRFQLASPSGSAARHSPVHNHSFSYISHDGESSESLSLQLTQALEKVSSMELRVLDMEREKRELTDRFEHALVDKQSLAAQLAALEQERDKLVSERQSTLTRDNKKIQQLVDGEVHALTLALDEKSEELTRVKRESTERLMVLENEVRRQADELDISRSKLATLAKLEASVAKYKKKLEEMNALRTQVKDLEIHNAQYLDKVLDLESTVKTMPTLKALVERYKNQVVDLETANVEAVSNNHVKDQKVRRLQEELDSALGGKEFLESQLEELRSQLASLQHAGHDDMAAVSSSGMSADVLLGRDGSGSLRERIARLERENAQLKSGEANAEETHLASELDLALKAKESLQFALLQLKQQNEELQEQLRLAQQQGSGASLSQASGAVAAGATAAAALSGQANASGVLQPGAASGPSAAGVTGVPGLAPAIGAVHDAQSAHLIGATGVVGALSHVPMGESASSGLAAAQVAAYEEKIQKLVSRQQEHHQALLAALSAAVAHVRLGAWSELVLEQVQIQLFSLLALVVGTVTHMVSTAKTHSAAAVGVAT